MYAPSWNTSRPKLWIPPQITYEVHQLTSRHDASDATHRLSVLCVRHAGSTPYPVEKQHLLWPDISVRSHPSTATVRCWQDPLHHHCEVARLLSLQRHKNRWSFENGEQKQTMKELPYGLSSGWSPHCIALLLSTH